MILNTPYVLINFLFYINYSHTLLFVHITRTYEYTFNENLKANTAISRDPYKWTLGIQDK